MAYTGAQRMAEAGPKAEWRLGDDIAERLALILPPQPDRIRMQKELQMNEYIRDRMIVAAFLSRS